MINDLSFTTWITSVCQILLKGHELTRNFTPSGPHHAHCTQVANATQHQNEDSFNCNCPFYIPHLCTDTHLWNRKIARSRPLAHHQSHYGIKPRHSHGVWNFSYHIGWMDHNDIKHSWPSQGRHQIRWEGPRRHIKGDRYHFLLWGGGRSYLLRSLRACL